VRLLQQDLPNLRPAQWHALCQDTQLFLRQRQAEDPKTELVVTLAHLLYNLQVRNLVSAPLTGDWLT